MVIGNPNPSNNLDLEENLSYLGNQSAVHQIPNFLIGP